MLLKSIQELEKVVNSELTSKIKKSTITFKELLIETDVENLFNIIQFLKSNGSCKFKQLIDIAGIDFPERDKRFRLVYLFLSHENNLRIKIVINFRIHFTLFRKIGKSRSGVKNWQKLSKSWILG